MTVASTGNPQESDDLTVIGGIGPARAKLLREALDVHSFQDLATLSVDEVKSQLRTEGQFVSEDEIEGWIAEARELAGAALEAEPNSANSGPEWESAATFVVEFQVREEGEERRSRVHHMEEDVDAVWPDIRPVELSRWMLEQLGEPAPELYEEMSAEARRELEQELQQMRSDAREELSEELEAERARLRREMEQKLEEQEAAAHRALQQELQETRASAEQELDEALEAERALLRQEMEQELEEQRVAGERRLEEDLQEIRSAARQELQEEVEVERARLRKGFDAELEERKAAAYTELEEELRDTRTKARQELDEALETERARLQRELEEELAEQRAEAEEALEQELALRRAEVVEPPVTEVELPSEEEAEVVSEPEPAPEIEIAPEPVTVEQPSVFEVEAFYIRQPPVARASRAVGQTPTSPDVFRSDIPFSLVASFKMDVADANELARKGATYTVQFQARELSTGEVLNLGTSQPYEYTAGKSRYEATLADVTLPAGLYRLTAFVSAGTTPPGGVYGEVATLLMA